MKKHITFLMLLFCLAALAIGCSKEEELQDEIQEQVQEEMAAEEPVAAADEDENDSITEEPEQIPEDSDGDQVTLDPEVKEITKPIKAGGPDHTFRFDYTITTTRREADYGEGFLESWSYAPITITVTGVEGALIQELSFTSASDWDPVAFRNLNVEEWRVVDINFDGYQDIVCLESVGGAKANHFYTGWLWDPAVGQFKETDISMICNLSVHEKDQSLRGVSADSAYAHTYEIYKYLDGKFVETNRLQTVAEMELPETGEELDFNYVEMDGYYFKIYAYEWVDGTLKEVFPEPICDTEDGQAVIYDYVYGSDSIWFGEQSPDFYESAYGVGVGADTDYGS